MLKLLYISAARIASTTLFAGKVLGMVVLLSGVSSFADAQDRGATDFGPRSGYKVHPDGNGGGGKGSPGIDPLLPPGAELPSGHSALCTKYLQAVANGYKIPSYNPCPTPTTPGQGSANSGGTPCAYNPHNCKAAGPK